MANQAERGVIPTQLVEKRILGPEMDGLEDATVTIINERTAELPFGTRIPIPTHKNIFKAEVTSSKVQTNEEYYEEYDLIKDIIG